VPDCWRLDKSTFFQEAAKDSTNKRELKNIYSLIWGGSHRAKAAVRIRSYTTTGWFNELSMLSAYVQRGLGEEEMEKNKQPNPGERILNNTRREPPVPLRSRNAQPLLPWWIKPSYGRRGANARHWRSARL